MNILASDRTACSGNHFTTPSGAWRACLLAICLVLCITASATAQAEAVQPQRTPVGNLTDSLNRPTVGRLSEHHLTFQLSDTIPVDAIFQVTLPSTFGLDSVLFGGYSDDDSANVDPKAAQTQVIDNSVWITLDSSGSPAAAGSNLSVDIAVIRNDTIAGVYSVSLAIYSNDSALLFGPTLSDPFNLAPDTAVSLSLSPTGPQSVIAGGSLLFNSDARDRYGNRVDTLTTSFRVEPASLGSINGSVLTAILADTGRVIVESASLADTSGLITVTPGALAQWQLSGFPAVFTAGAAPSPGSIIVEAQDAFGNRKYDYLGTVYFEATDSLAVLPATASSPYNFQPADSGRKQFDRVALRFYTAGNDTVITSGGGITASLPIHINPAAVSVFTVTAADTVTAGVPFPLNITGAVDAYGNPASGTITLTLDPGDSLSPGGHQPVLPQVAVAGGIGSASVTLVQAGSYPIFGRGAGARYASNTVTIMAGKPGVFDWLLTGPMVSGVSFPAVATLTAYDLFGNLATRYDPGSTPVVLSAVNGDSMSNNVLGPGTFTNGVADLAAFGVTYHGRGGQVRFAAGAGPALGISEPVTVIALRADTLRFNQTRVRRGVDTLTGSVIADVNGAGSVTITGIELTSPYGDFPLSNITPFLPNSISGPATREYTFRWKVPATLPQECINFGVRIAGDFSAAAVTDEFQGGPCIEIAAASQTGIAALLPNPVAYAPVEYRATVTNSGPGDLQLTLDSVALIIADGVATADTAHTTTSGQVFIAAGSSTELALRTVHTAPFVGDSAFASLQLIGTESGIRFDTTVAAPEPVHFVTAAQLFYVAGSLTPDTLVSGTADTLRLRISNSGGATVESIDRAATYLRLSGASDTIRVSFDNTLTPLSTMPPGDTTLAFVLDAAAARVAAGTYAAEFTMTGTQSNRSFSATEVLSDSLVFVEPARIRIDSVWAIAPNLPFVTTEQVFQISAAVSNTGTEPIDSVVLKLAADAGALFVATRPVAPLAPSESQVATWPVTADVSPNSLETFTVQIDRSLGVYTNKPAAADPPLDDQASIQIQAPANLASQVAVTAPPEAADLRIAAGSEFTVTGRIANSGEAQVGDGELTISADAGVIINGAAAQTVPPNGAASWTLKAPAAETTATVRVTITSTPTESNRNVPAPVSKPADSLGLEFVFETPPLTIFDVQFASGLLTADQPTLTFSWTNNDRSGLFPILLKSCAFGVTSGNGTTPLNPQDLFSSAQLTVDAQPFTATLSNTAITFGVDSLLRIPAGDTHRVELTVVPRADAVIGDLRLVTQAGLWDAIERSTDGAGLAVSVEDESGRALDLISPVLYRTSDRATCYPNPFRAGSDAVRIQYRLPADATTSVKIYTAAGTEVWTQDYAAGTEGGRAGDNEITWDGRNGRESVVFDGVYFMHIQGGGLDQTLKIVVMK